MTDKNCTICNKPIVLVPSAAERAAKDLAGKSASYYTSLFTTHSECAVAQRSEQARQLMVSGQHKAANYVHPHLNTDSLE
jgi:hypothetical protein